MVAEAVPAAVPPLSLAVPPQEHLPRWSRVAWGERQLGQAEEPAALGRAAERAVSLLVPPAQSVRPVAEP